MKKFLSIILTLIISIAVIPAYAFANAQNSQSQWNNYLGVPTNGVLDDEYVEILKQRYKNADPIARRVFDRFAPQLKIQNTNYPFPPFSQRFNEPYRPRGVYYNAAYDKTNPSGSGQAFYHELGHGVDAAATGNGGPGSKVLSNTTRLSTAMYKDALRIVNAFKNLNFIKKYYFIYGLYDKSAYIVSDLLGAMTGNKLTGQAYHPNEYWYNNDGRIDHDTLNMETFANFFEASMGNPKSLSLVKNFFPSAFEAFSKMLKSLLPDRNCTFFKKDPSKAEDKDKAFSDFIKAFTDKGPEL
ncbi:MAG: hypothetical protein IJ758_03060 [Clostridia bacterium]|nr:hypothetical protein [Clostridia bacterium]